MTAYADRLQRLTGGEPSLRVRPRSRFEPVLARSEPPWERGAGPPFELAGEVDTALAEPRGAPAPGGRPQAAEQAHGPGRITGLPGRPRQPAAGDLAAAGPATASAHTARPASFPAAEHDDSRVQPARTGHGEETGRGEAGETAGPRPEAGRHPAAPDRPAGRASSAQARRGAATSMPAGPAWRSPGTGSPAESSSSRDPAPGSSLPASPRPVNKAPAGSGHAPAGHAPAGTADARHVSRPAGGEERVGQEPGRTAGWGGHLPATDLPGGEPVREERVGQEPGRTAGWGGRLPVTDLLGGVPVGPGDRPLRYLAAGLGAQQLPAGDPARAGTTGLSGAERKTADPGPEAPGDVTVTIGRIDVRVGPPQSTASPAAAAAQSGGDGPARPVPSRLEDYLRARSSGRVG
jgi:hypothetical protein